MKAFIYVGVALLVLWAVLWLGFKIASGLIHLVVIVAIALIIWGLLRRGARAIT